MNFLPKGKPIELDCNQPLILEFTDLLFGNFGTSIYFDATDYLTKTKKTETVEGFLLQYNRQIEGLLEPYSLHAEDICKYNSKAHILIESHLAYLFITYLEPDFLAYLLDRVNELLTTGFAVSDSYLLSSVRYRFPKEVLNEFLNG